LFENDPGNKVNSGETFGKGKHVIFAVPGAFTPGCSQVIITPYMSGQRKYKIYVFLLILLKKIR